MSSSRPGVDIEQVLAAAGTTAVTPTLVPVVLGICNQIVEVLDSEGAINADAKYADSQYLQASMLITQAEFPDPRSNIDELNIDEATVKAYLKFGGKLKNLPRGSNDSYGQAFLKGQNTAKRAAFLSTTAGPYAFGATAIVFTFCVDVPNETDTSQDIVVSLSGTLSTTQVAAAVNTAAGADVATADAGDFLQITSLLYGAGSSVTIRSGGAALALLCAGAGYDTAVEYKVTGSGFYGQDDSDGDLTTPWIAYFRGKYAENGSENTTWDAWALLVDADDATQNTRDAALTYTGAGADIPMKAATATKPGDQFWADGVQVGGGQIIKVENTRFKLGTLNNVRSTFDDDGEPTNRVYDTYEVNILIHSSPMAPKYAYFRADGLVFGEVTPIGAAATVTGTEVGLAARAAVVQSTTDISFPVSPAGLTLIYTLTVDGVAGDEQTVTITGGPFANIGLLEAAITTALDNDDIDVGSAGDRLSLATAATGSDQSISISEVGTANPALEFSAVTATTDTGKDAEFCTQATLQGAYFTLPVGTELSGKTFALTIVDAKGTHAISGAMGSNPATTSALIAALSSALGGDGVNTIADGDILCGSISTAAVGDGVRLTITTTEGGADVTLSLTATDDTDGFRFLGFYDNAGDEPAVVTADSVVTDFVDLRGLQVVGAASGFRLAVAGIPVPLVATDITIPALTYDVDQLATAIALAVTTAIAGGGNPVCTCAFSRATGFFTLTIVGGTLTITAHTGTDLSDEFFGTGYTSAQASPWVSLAPDLAFATIAITVGGTLLTALATLPMVAATIVAPNTTAAGAVVDILNSTAALHTSGTRIAQYFVDAADKINVRAVIGGAGVSATIAAAQPGFVALGFNAAGVTDAGAASAGNSDDTGADGIKGESFGFYLDANPTLLELVFNSNSLQEAIDDINTLVAGAGDVASEDSGALVLTSLYAGVASSVQVYTTAPYDTAALAFGLSGTAVGSGRPDPDFYLDVDGSANIAANILRNTATGIPFSLSAGRANLYLQYTALRLDVTASAEDPALLSFDTTSDMEEAIGPISTKNPLALGTYLAMLNVSGTSVSAMGVDEKNDAAPFGTLDGWSRTLDLLEQKEVYALAPITDDEYIQGLVASHVQAMSEPAQRMERICFLAPPFPTRETPTTVLSGEDGETNGIDNSFTLDDSPSAELAALGITGPAIDYDDDLYLELLVTSGGATELRRYSVSNVNNTVLTLRVTFSATQNVDGFFTTETLDEELSGTDWTLFVRGTELLVAGTTRADLGATATTAAAEGQAYAHRRVFMLFAKSVDVSLDGVTQNIPVCYAAAAVAGMVAQLAPQQPFTNVSMVGLGKVYGTDDTFNEDKLDTIADGGRYILVNQGGRVASRHSRSTDVTTIVKQELSITKSLDWLAKGLRQTNRVFIGKYVITPNFLDQLSMSNEGFLKYAVNMGVVNGADLTEIAQSTDEPDTILLEVEVQPAYPCNKIKITILA